MKIEMKNINKKFEGNEILSDINIIFESGKTYGLLGRNGSGKSVLFKVLCGFYMPNKGDIIVDGVNYTKEKKLLSDARVLIEHPTFLPDISGFENLKILADIDGKIDDIKINEALDVVNLMEDRNKKYHKYSLGMKQKLGIAQVIMENPPIMILDEPFNGIEQETVEKIKKYFKDMNKKDKIIIFSSHIQSDIYELCEEIYQIDNGKISNLTV